MIYLESKHVSAPETRKATRRHICMYGQQKRCVGSHLGRGRMISYSLVRPDSVGFS